MWAFELRSLHWNFLRIYRLRRAMPTPGARMDASARAACFFMRQLRAAASVRTSRAQSASHSISSISVHALSQRTTCLYFRSVNFRSRSAIVLILLDASK